MTEWKKVKLGDYCEITSSKRIFLSEYTDTGILFCRSKEIIEMSENNEISEPLYISETKYKEIKERFGVPQVGDLLLTSVGTIGVPYVVKDNDCFYFKDGNLTWFRHFKQNVDSTFVYYWIKSSEGYGVLNNTTIGSSQKALTISALKRLEIPCPPIAIQHSIATTLSRYDALIENYHRQIKLLEEAAQRLYKEWFVDLHFPGHENVKVVDGVPEGWEKKKIKDVCETIGGGTPSTKERSYYEGGNIKWVTPTDITRSRSICLLDTEKKITEEGLNHSSAKMLPAGTILMTSRASVGYFGLFDCEVCTNQGFISCIPNNANIQFYLLYNLKNRVDEIRGKAGGSTYLEISKKVFRSFDIVLPTEDICCQFQSVIEHYIKSIRTLTNSISLLTESRDRLLPKLMSGEIEI